MDYVSFELKCVYWGIVLVLIVYVGYTMYRGKSFDRDVDL